MNGKDVLTYTDSNAIAHTINNVAQIDICFLGNIDDGVVFDKDENWNFIQVIVKENDKLSKQIIRVSDIMQMSIVNYKEK